MNGRRHFELVTSRTRDARGAQLKVLPERSKGARSVRKLIYFDLFSFFFVFLKVCLFPLLTKRFEHDADVITQREFFTHLRTRRSVHA